MRDVRMSKVQSRLRAVVLGIGALAFLFPFYYMVIGSLQTEPDPTVGGAFPNPANLTVDNYTAINERINLLQGLVNSGIFTGGVLLGTMVFGLLVGYALAQLEWRGRGATFALALLWRIALPLVRPAIITVVLLTFIGPWNEFLWPFLITKDAALQPLAVSLANYISNVAASASNPFGATLAGAVVLAGPVVLLFIFFQRYFISNDIGSGVKG